jgi:hypothetical protein
VLRTAIEPLPAFDEPPVPDDRPCAPHLGREALARNGVPVAQMDRPGDRDRADRDEPPWWGAGSGCAGARGNRSVRGAGVCLVDEAAHRIR